MDPSKPVIMQGDQTLLLEVDHPKYQEARKALLPFCEIIKSPRYVHTYRITYATLWNAASAGFTQERILSVLENYSRYEIPSAIKVLIVEAYARYGKIGLYPYDEACYKVKVTDENVFREISHQKFVADNIVQMLAPGEFLIERLFRGTIKEKLIKVGYPVQDFIPLKKGDPLDVEFAPGFALRSYQEDAVESFFGKDEDGFGFGTIVMPCGAGKTVVGIGILERLKCKMLCLTTNIVAVHQWIDELLEKTNLTREDVGEYTGSLKQIKPVTVSTYQMVMWRKAKGEFSHFNLFAQNNWGLVIYDEVHLVPAPIFRLTAELQSVYRLGMTATLVREDNQEDVIYSLIGPKRFDIPWKDMEDRGWIASASCYEIWVPFSRDLLLEYATATKRSKQSIAAMNPAKLNVIASLLERHKEDSILIIGLYIKQLKEVSARFGLPLITGQTKDADREEIFRKFQSGEIPVLVVSKVANFAINLPDANVAIQISSSFGSRQEEAQRLGRILRPGDKKKKKNSYFYSVLTKGTTEEQYSTHRQQFLAEQGYQYYIELWDETGSSRS